MSLKEDFVEAVRSFKRDVFRESEYAGSGQSTDEAGTAGSISYTEERPVGSSRAWGRSSGAERTEYPPAQPDDVVMSAFRQASTVGEDAYQDQREDGSSSPPYRSYDPNDRGIPSYLTQNAFEDGKTIISKNTIIRGAIQTQDSMQLLGQVMGDIECSSNIIVAGKVRGNTSAANAYIVDAQVDGDVRCDDSINISDDAWVLGNIKAQEAEVDGKVKGNLEIRHMVSIGSTSSVLGDISADELEIRRGAFVNGQIMMYSPSRDVVDRFDHFEITE